MNKSKLGGVNGKTAYALLGFARKQGPGCLVNRTAVAILSAQLPLLSMPIATDAALAQSSSTQKSEEEIKSAKERAIEWFNTCMGDWDRATHMTKAEWRITCERVARERGKWLLENPTRVRVEHKGGGR
jgi:hypothetical protein